MDQISILTGFAPAVALVLDRALNGHLTPFLSTAAQNAAGTAKAHLSALRTDRTADRDHT
ncbi:hypothetical protein [Actinomadura hibisca]|uniref:hypothetical protein n=1 Tax=Actinomadura hibisca TaxID=68565 RepID=UPI00082CFF5D|nr:hypothetical protein [Actinomadura hibisca]